MSDTLSTTIYTDAEITAADIPTLLTYMQTLLLSLPTIGNQAAKLQHELNMKIEAKGTPGFVPGIH